MTISYLASPLARKHTVAVPVGKVICGGSAPVVVQSMTNTDTADINATVQQVAALARVAAGVTRRLCGRRAVIDDPELAELSNGEDDLVEVGVVVDAIGVCPILGLSSAFVEGRDKIDVNEFRVILDSRRSVPVVDRAAQPAS